MAVSNNEEFRKKRRLELAQFVANELDLSKRNDVQVSVSFSEDKDSSSRSIYNYINFDVTKDGKEDRFLSSSLTFAHNKSDNECSLYHSGGYRFLSEQDEKKVDCIRSILQDRKFYDKLYDENFDFTGELRKRLDRLYNLDKNPENKFDYYIMDNSDSKNVHIMKFENENEASDFLVKRRLKDLESKGQEINLEDVQDIETDIKKKLKFSVDRMDSTYSSYNLDVNEFYIGENVRHQQDLSLGTCIIIPKDKSRSIDTVILANNGQTDFMICNRQSMIDYVSDSIKLEDFNCEKNNNGEYKKTFIDGKEVSYSDFVSKEAKTALAKKWFNGKSYEVEGAKIEDNVLKNYKNNETVIIQEPRTVSFRERLTNRVNSIMNKKEQYKSSAKKREDRQPLTKEEKKVLTKIQAWSNDNNKWDGHSFDVYRNYGKYWDFYNDESKKRDTVKRELSVDYSDFSELKHKDYVRMTKLADENGFGQSVKDAQDKIIAHLVSHMDVSFDKQGNASYSAILQMPGREGGFQVFALGGKDEVFKNILKTAENMYWDDKSPNSMNPNYPTYKSEGQKGYEEYQELRNMYYKAEYNVDDAFINVAVQKGIRDGDNYGKDGMNHYNPFSERANRQEVSALYPRKFRLTEEFVTSLAKELAFVKTKKLEEEQERNNPRDKNISLAKKQEKDKVLVNSKDGQSL